MQADLATIRSARLANEPAVTVNIQKRAFGPVDAHVSVGAHVFDDAGHAMDVAATAAGAAAGPGIDPTDSLFDATFQVPQGWSANLGVTSYVDIPQADGSLYRDWEQINHPVAPPLAEDGLQMAAWKGSNHATGNFDFGSLDFGVGVDRSAATPSWGGVAGLQSVQVVPGPNGFAGVGAQLVLKAHPVVTLTDDDPAFGTVAHSYPDLNQTVTLTLNRQADGSFAAQTPDQTSLFDTVGIRQSYGQAPVSPGSLGVGGNSRLVTGWSFHFLDPATGKVFQNGQQDYFVASP